MGYGILNEDLSEPYIKDILKFILATSFTLANDLLVLKFCFNYFWSVLNFFFHNCVMLLTS